MNTANNRTINKEQYFTDENVAYSIMNEISKLPVWDNAKLIVEPSCGTGSFIKCIKDKLVIGFDIEPRITGDNIFQVDFLSMDMKNILPRKEILVVGNPPFGRGSMLAKAFINKCTEFCDDIIMIMPISIATSKYGMKGLNPLLHIKSWKRLPYKNIWSNEFGEPLKKSSIIRTALIHFEMRETKRPTITKVSNGIDWRFVKNAEPLIPTDIVIFRFGPKISLVGNKTIIRDPNIVVRASKSVDINLLTETIKLIRKVKKLDTTTSMLNTTRPMVAEMLNKYFS